ncbi:MAG: spermidine synthase [Phenylobacterium sp.]|jgi:spermidine synthase
MALLDKLLGLMARENTLLNLDNTDGQRIEIHQHGDYRWVFTGGVSIQSVLSLQAPESLVMPYQNMMLVVLLLPQLSGRRCPNILNLGFGGGGFERFFSALKTAQDDMNMVSVELDAQMVALAKTHLLVPQTWPVKIEAAQLYLSRHCQREEQRFDLILCDLFNGQYHADCLEQKTFYADAADTLTADGVMAVNLAPQSDQELVDILAVTRACFAGVMVSKVEHLGNIVMVLSKQPLPTMAVLHRLAEEQEKLSQWPLDFVTLLAGFKPLPNLAGERLRNQN